MPREPATATLPVLPAAVRVPWVPRGTATRMALRREVRDGVARCGGLEDGLL